MALRGFPFEPGDLVLVSALEHNALMRPLRLLEQTKGIEVQALPYAEAGIIDLDLLESTVRKRRPRLCAFLEASNVTGEILDIAAVSELCRRYELPLLIDAAQSAGVFHEKPNSNWISFWSAPAHKGLMGIPGLGLLYVHESMNLEPLVCGGTGSKSEKLEMPDFYPDRLEAGTMPVQAVAALAAGLDFLQETGLEKIKEHEAKLCKLFLNHLKTLAEKGLELELFAGVAEKRCSLLSFRVKGNDPAEMAELLDRDYGICVRAGLHCAALAHQSLGTQNTGLLRVSFGYFNTESELEILCDAISEITKMKTAKPRK